ncbi:carotenoid oxygenase family protein [Streptomyces sp. NPDC054863]
MDDGGGVFGSEATLATRAGGASEDDGCLVTLTSDMNADRSECLVFDAARLSDGPLARVRLRVRLPERISSGTHAAWAPGPALRGWYEGPPTV